MKELDVATRSVGSWCQIAHPAIAEILARAGFQWIAADCEHGEFETGDIATFVRAVRQFDCIPLVRVRENATLPIRRALDLGAAGVIVPLVHTAEDARRAVKSARYPPDGVRGFAWHRANSWGVDFDSYARDFDPLVLVMIESKEGVDNAEKILAVDGVDGCFVGPYDMTGSYGILGQTGHTLIRDAMQTVADAARVNRKAAGQHIVTPTSDNVALAFEQGYTFVALGMDSYFLSGGASRVLGLLE